MSAIQTETLCAKCKASPGVVKGRNENESTCGPCFKSYVFGKVVKRLGAHRKELLGPGRPRTLKYLVGLSLGASSATLVHMLAENRKYTSEKAKGNIPVAFEILAVHVDTDLTPRREGEISSAAQVLEKYAEIFPDLQFRCVPLSTALGIDSIDWNALPRVDEGPDPAQRIQGMFDRLPSLTSRADILRVFIRHILLAEAVKNESDALLLGCSTTALAEMTLSEVAKGRGFSVPWQINDGPHPIPQTTSHENGPESSSARSTAINLYYPLRDVFRKEINTYLQVSTPLMSNLIPESTASNGTVISHKDLSIEEAMARYFESVEDGYPAVVANVVKTTSKLSRVETSTPCSMCSMPVDEPGDARWKGEIGHEESVDQVQGSGQLCYGCERSIRG